VFLRPLYKNYQLRTDGILVNGIVDGTCGGEEGCRLVYSFEVNKLIYRGSTDYSLSNSKAKLHDSITVIYMQDDPSQNEPARDVLKNANGIKYP
jgi:hypothetical protein